MLNSFIHFQDSQLESVKIYSYNDEGKNSLEIAKLTNISDSLKGTSKVFVMIPSQLFGFVEYENKAGHKGEVLKANVFTQVEEQLISDVSSLKFFYNPDLKLASWIDLDIFHSISNTFNELDLEIVILPEHFLILQNQNIIYLDDNIFILAFADNSGFGGSTEILHEYSATLDINAIDLNSFQLLQEKQSIKTNFFKESQPETRSLLNLHTDFLNLKQFNSMNLFSRKISFKFLKSKLKLSFIESFALAASISIILIAPLLINSSLNFSITSYEDNTIQIFKQLNPSFKRLINPKAQIDDLTRDIPFQPIVSSQNLEALGYIEQLADESIESITIDLIESTVSAKVSNLPAYKLTFFKELMKAESVEINAENLRQGPEGLFGNLIISYDPK
jgi:hypothetical protein